MQSLPYPRYRMEEIWKEGTLLGWEELKGQTREYIKYLVNNLLLSELELFVGCGRYERREGRRGYRNGYYERLIASTLGEIEIRYPRLRKGHFESKLIKKYSRRQQEVDFAVLSCFLLGGSVRKTSKVCKAFADVDISPGTVSNIFKELDQKAKGFHFRKIEKKYQFLILDGLWIKIRDKYKKEKVVLFAMGITFDGKKEILDFMLADGESESAYVTLLNHLLKRGLDSDVLELVIHDGAPGIVAALDLCLPYSERQYCVFHKIQGIAQKLKHKPYRKLVMSDARNIYKRSRTKQEAIAALELFVRKWAKVEPRVTRYMQWNFDQTLKYFDFPRDKWKMITTTNYLERSLREIRRRTRPMGCFQNDKSTSRIIYSLVYLLNSGEIPKNEFTQLS